MGIRYESLFLRSAAHSDIAKYPALKVGTKLRTLYLVLDLVEHVDLFLDIRVSHCVFTKHCASFLIILVNAYSLTKRTAC